MGWTSQRQSFSELHDGIHGVVSGLSEHSHGFSPRAAGVFHHHLDVVGGQASLVDFLGRGLDLGSHFGGGGLHLLSGLLGSDGVLELVDFVLAGLESVHVGLSEDNVGVLVSGSFPDIGVIDADDEGLSLLDGDSVDAGDGLEPHLGHGLLELLLSPVGFHVKVLSLVLVLMIVVLMGVLVIVVAVLTVDVGLFLLDLFSHNSNLKKQILNIDQLDIMTSEQQYYEAKVFLTAYHDALSTLDEIAGNRATVEKYKAYEKYLLLSNQKGEIHVEGNHIRPGTYFNESRIRQLGQFSKNLFATKLANFDAIHTYADLTKALQAYL